MAYVARRLARCGVYSWRRARSARLLSSRPDGSEGVVERSEGATGEVDVVRADQLVPVSDLSGIPREQLLRVARISMPARNPMQSGSNNTLQWRLAFETQERWENPLMGWTSSADPLSNVSLMFDTKEEAVAFAVKNGWAYEIEQPKRLRMVAKTYAENFSWDKKTRVVTK